MDQDAGTVQRRNDPEGDDTRSADGKGHRKAGEDAPEEAEEYDEQADLDAIKSK